MLSRLTAFLAPKVLIVTGVLAIALAGSVALNVHQLRQNGVVSEKLATANRTVANRDATIKRLGEDAKKAAGFERGSYETCQTQAAETASEAYQRGVLVGRTLQRRTQCAPAA